MDIYSVGFTEIKIKQNTIYVHFIARQNDKITTQFTVPGVLWLQTQCLFEWLICNLNYQTLVANKTSLTTHHNILYIHVDRITDYLYLEYLLGILLTLSLVKDHRALETTPTK